MSKQLLVLSLGAGYGSLEVFVLIPGLATLLLGVHTSSGILQQRCILTGICFNKTQEIYDLVDYFRWQYDSTACKNILSAPNYLYLQILPCLDGTQGEIKIQICTLGRFGYNSFYEVRALKIHYILGFTSIQCTVWFSLSLPPSFFLILSAGDRTEGHAL